jgi:hypothetical protein
MPSHPVINRRNLSPLVRKTVLVSEAALERINDIGAELHVSQGSLVDTALYELAARPPEEIAKLLRAHGHLTDEEYAYVTGRRRAAKKGRK